MKFLKTRKSPGPDSMTYENWRSLDPKLTPFVVKAFSETLTSGNLDPEWFRFYVRPLPKKPGRPEVRTVSLLNSIVKIMDRPPGPTETRPLDPRGTSCVRHTIWIHGRKVLLRRTVSSHE